MLGKSFERRALELGATAVVTVGAIAGGFMLLNVRSDLAVLAGGALCAAAAIVGGARMVKLLGRETDETKRLK